MAIRKMLISSLFGMLMLLLVTGSGLAQTGKSLIVRPASGAFAGKTFYTNSHALVIGISRYGFLPREQWLNYAAKDASDLRDVLIRSYGFLSENVTVLLNEQATKANIEHALSALADGSQVKRDDRVLIFFSGHGQTVKSGINGEMGFLIPYDAKVDLAHPENRGPYLEFCLPMDHLWSYVEGSPAKHSLIIADTCFGGLLVRSRATIMEKPTPAVVSSLLARPAQQALTAGGKGEEVPEDPKLGHGYLSFKLLEELRTRAATPDSVFLISQLASSLKLSVAGLTHAKQTPQFGSHNETDGDFVFVTTPPQPVPPLPSLNGNGGVVQEVKTKINPKDGAVMTFIPAGEFLMGDDDDGIKDLALSVLAHHEVRNNPRHKVTLSGYWIYKDLVTVGMYKKFCQATGKQMPPEPVFNGNHFNPDWSKEEDPIVNVTWDDAVAYCAWAGVVLPTEAQWEKAARGVDGLKFPWGNTFDPSKVWASKSLFGDAGGTHRVGELGISPYGCTDMSGNVWQWCADWYDAGFWGGPQAKGADPVNQDLGEKKYRVVRGGSWFSFDGNFFRTSFRAGFLPGNRDSYFGFRALTP